ncbi:AAA-like domain-containing protein [Leptolyngbya sp. KIOST-1]|uniref:AAA-like domain-containing protein n=1 Tax=Leptolyngbya sp. KIOST-1 TaxID=1229172 RepID=UPI00055BD087|nr:AAA-like domain-containing protein [Leptolyngbya sp. KIOST-1]
MTSNELFRLVEQTLQRPLTTLEKLVVEGSWQGLRYRHMADESGYVEEYIKQVGAKLWAELSAQTGSTVTKKNLRLLFGIVNEKAATAGEAGGALAAAERATRGNAAAIAPAPVKLSSACFDFPSGPLPLGSALYIARPPVEDTACGEILRPGGLLCIKAPRRFGKTSLLQRVITYGTAQGYRSCRIDLLEADDDAFGSIDGLLRWFCRSMLRTLDLDLPLDQVWDPDLGSKVNGGLVVQQVLTEAEVPLVLSINALERVFFFASVAQDFLSLLRFWHERSKDSSPWQRLRLVLVYDTDSYVALNLDVSPFNVGHSVRLPPFTLAQFLELGRRYGLPTIDAPRQRFTLEALYRLIAGHPYLANLSFYSLAQGEQAAPDLLNSATTPASIFHSHLQELWAQLRKNPAVLAAWQAVIDAQDRGWALNAIDTMRLESMGLIRTENGLAYPLCDLYQRFFAAQFETQA